MRRLRVALGDEAGVPRFIETIHKRGYRFLAVNRHAVPAVSQTPQTRARVAVLPFGPCGAFSEGLTEEAITRLMQACPHSIGVIARTSVERAQRHGGGAAEIGRTLSADYLVHGYVRHEGDRVRITAQLIEAQDETHVWADTFDRTMTDPLALQTEVAEEITKAVTNALGARFHRVFLSTVERLARI